MNLYNDLWILDTQKNTFEKLSATGDPPSKRWGHTACKVDETLFVFGGIDAKGRVGDLYTLNLTTFEWKKPELKSQAKPGETQPINNNPSPRAGHSAIIVGRKMIVYGGADGRLLHDLYYLNVDTKQWFR